MDSSTEKTAYAIWEKSCEKLSSARLLLEHSLYSDSLSRSYYAAFHAVSLLLFLSGKSFSRHSSLIGAFNNDFIATGIFPIPVGKALSTLFDARQSGDYDVFQPAEEAEARQGITDAELILRSVQDFCRTRYSLSLYNLPENNSKTLS